MARAIQLFSNPWLIIGFAGQTVFAMRFLVQWVASERAHRSVVPGAFWHLSLAGAFMLLLYAISQRDPVFILGNTTGFLIYTRNLVLRRRDDGASERTRDRP